MSRSNYKGPYFRSNLLKEKNKIKVINKNLMILPEHENCFARIYNGKQFINLKITKKMLGFKFGEFIYTRKKHLYKKK